MLVTPSIRETPTDRADVYAFHIMGEVSEDDMEDMAERMNDVFDRHDKVSMLLIFDRYEGAETQAHFDWDVIRSRLRSVTKVEKYAVAKAPERAGKLVERFGKLLPLEARAFDDVDAAWVFVGARPVHTA
ncbi:STAS/SEC14 domain-containing protein [Palleronia sediminis]|nr:STAS/SEC14 domain-containing protein [Palleronia sediminis]